MHSKKFYALLGTETYGIARNIIELEKPKSSCAKIYLEQ